MAIIELTLGAEVECTDGKCGHLTEVVVDSSTLVVTYLVVEPFHRSGLGRLVPLRLLDTVAERIVLACSLTDFEKLERGERTGLLPGSNGGYGGYGLGQAVPGSYVNRSSFGVLGGGKSDAFDPVVYDSLPPNAVGVRAVTVQAVDGVIGHLRGVRVDLANHYLTHVLLQEGHLWGRKSLAIPATSVADLEGAIRLNITKDQAEELVNTGVADSH